MNFDYSRFYMVCLSDSAKTKIYRDKITKIKNNTFFSKAKFTLLYCKDSVSSDFLLFAYNLGIKIVDVTLIKELLSNELDKKLYSVFEVVSKEVNIDTKLPTNILKILHHNVTNYGIYLDLESIPADAIDCNDISKLLPEVYGKFDFTKKGIQLPIYSCLKFEVLQYNNADTSIKELTEPSKELLTKVQNKFLQSIDYLVEDMSRIIQLHKIPLDYLHHECTYSSYRNSGIIPDQPL